MAEDKDQPEINWQDFNYPPLLKLMHFVPSEIKEHRMVIMMRFSVHLILLLEFFLNIIDNAIQTSLGFSGIRILYSFLFFIFVAIDLIAFYRAYTGILKDKSMMGIYIYLEPILIGLWVTFSIANFLGFNGFIQMVALFNDGFKAPAVLSLLESLLFVVCACISAFCYYKVCYIRNHLKAKLINSVV